MQFFSKFSLACTAIVAYFKNNPKKLIIAVAIAAACFGGYKVKEAFTELEAKNAKLQVQIGNASMKNSQLVTDIKACADANRTNEITIKQIGAAALDYQKQVVELNKSKATVMKKGQDLLNDIQHSRPQDDGPVAGVLKSTIESIQSYRKENQ